MNITYQQLSNILFDIINLDNKLTITNNTTVVKLMEQLEQIPNIQYYFHEKTPAIQQYEIFIKTFVDKYGSTFQCESYSIQDNFLTLYNCEYKSYSINVSQIKSYTVTQKSCGS